MDFFDGESPLLSWIGDETFFGLCSRQHQLWGHGNSATTALMLFGQTRLGTHHDLPSGLGAFSLRSQHALGSAASLALERTLLAYYRPFLSASEIKLAVSDMQGSSVAHLKLRLGLLTSRFRAHHPLKACLQCMSKDRQNHGWVTWHLAHQYPGVWFCPHHNTPLMSSRLKSTGVDRFLWCLPANDELAAWDQQTNPMSADALAGLAAFISGLYALKLQDGELSVDGMQAVIRAELLERGWMTAAGQLRLAALSESYLEHVRPLRVLTELNALAEDEHEVKAQVGRLLRPMRSGTHPLRWLVMAHWLFGSAETFLRAVRISAAYRSEAPPFTVCAPPDLTTTHGEVDVRQKIVERARAGESVTSLATEAHVDVTTVMAWVAAAGIWVKRRPKKLTVDRLEPLLSDLRGGMGRDEAAKRHAISLATVDKILRTEVGLHQVWRTARLERARTDARSIWSALNDQSPGVGAKLMRFMEPKTYAWLYRNDRAWLVDNSPSRRRDVSSQRTNVRWDERDLALSQRVQRALAELQQAGGGRRVHLWQVYQAVPELKPKLQVLGRLPLTKRALESAVAIRRKAPDTSAKLI